MLQWLLAKQGQSGQFSVCRVSLWDVYMLRVVQLWQETAVTANKVRV